MATTASLLRILRAVHDSPAAPTRALLSRQLGLGRGAATVLVGDLKQRRLLAEVDPGERRGPGRPTARLVPHPEGPLVLAAAITHDGWTLDAVELGAGTVRAEEGRHDTRRGVGVLDTIAAAGRRIADEFPGRVGALALSLPATVYSARIAHASLLGWAGVEALQPFAGLGVPATMVNDATAAGIGEVRRGAARDHRVVLHVHADAGVGGALFVAGRPVPDARGAGGEFGHMPLAGGDRPCHCGARGCWDLVVGNLALVGSTARGASIRRAAAAVLDRARAGDPEALARVTEVGTALGRGLGALVNGYDPELVTLSGTAATVKALAPGAVRRAYRSALMRFRRTAPPPVRTSALGGDGQRTGTADLAFDLLLTDRLLTDR